MTEPKPHEAHSMHWLRFIGTGALKAHLVLQHGETVKSLSGLLREGLEHKHFLKEHA